MATYKLDDVLANNEIAPKGKYSLDEVLGREATAGDYAKETGRQLGLATRHGVQGLAGTAGLLVDPINALINTSGTNIKTLRSATSSLLDRAGLPKPNSARERNVAEASEMLAGTGGIVKLAGKGNAALQTLAARPGLQSASASGAGYAGSEAREQGYGPAGQFGASLLGGIGAPVSLATLEGATQGIGRRINNFINPQQVNQQVDTAIAQAGVNPETLPPDAINQLRLDVQKTLTTGNEASPDALRRLADYRALSAVPMRGNLTLKPVDITRDKNLAKIGANSRDPAQQALANIQNSNNRALIENLNTLGANPKDDVYGAGQKVIGALEGRDKGAKSIIGNAYNTARNTEGRSAAIDPSAFTQKANDLLDFNNVGSKLPIDIRNKMNDIALGKIPLTVDVAEQLKTSIYGLSKNEQDGNVRTALSAVRTALDEAPLLDNQGQQAINNFTNARRLNASYMKNVEKTPALQAVRDGIEPDKFVQKFIIGNSEKSNVMDVAMLKKNIKGNPEATDAIRGQILSHLKGKGLSGASDEVGNFSPSGYKGALDNIGERKLKMFFDANEIEQLKRIARVASYENVQPRGSAVNNSNTAAAAFNAVIDGIGKYVPFGEMAIAGPARNVNTAINARTALNVPKSLAMARQRQPLAPSMLPLTINGAGMMPQGLLGLLPPEE
jgi:hypothetical protein